MNSSTRTPARSVGTVKTAPRCTAAGSRSSRAGSAGDEDWACAELYRELCNLSAQGAWEQLLLGGGATWAQQQAAAKARAAKTAKDAQAPPDQIVPSWDRA
jgi:hypothetical protein